MKKPFIMILGVAALWVICAFTPAFGFLGGDGIPNIFGSPQCGAKMDKKCGPFAVPTIYFGWLEHQKGTTWALQRPDQTGTASWPLRGFWVGASVDTSLNERFGLTLAGSLFLPKRSSGAWFTEPLSDTFDFEVPSYDWWSADALGRINVAGDVEVIGGFRWDHTSTRVSYSDNTDDDYILNLYMPLIGLQVRVPGSGGGMLVRFMGSPFVPGQLRYHFWDPQSDYTEFGNFSTKSGYLLELFANYSFRLGNDLGVGAFVRWNSLQLKTAERALSGSVNEPILWTVYVQSWTVGGSVSLAFASPF